MNIFFCETYDDGTVGGSHRCLYNLVRHLDRSRIRCTVGFYAENIYVPLYRRLGVDAVILDLPKPLRNGNVLLRKTMNWYNLEYKAGRYLRDYLSRGKFDLVVLNNSIYASLLFVRACKALGLPVVVYERGIGYFRKEHLLATEEIQASIAISDAVYRFLLQNRFRTRIIERIYDGIEPEEMQVAEDPGEIKASLKIPPSSRVIGIVGNIRPWKGHRDFIRAFLRLAPAYRDLRALVIGGCSPEDEAFRSELIRTVQREGLQDRVLFPGYRQDIPRLMSILDVFVHASTKPEPFGMVILEAMAAGRPVVATNLGGPVEILDGGRYGLLVPPGDSLAIAEACARCLADPWFAQQRSDRAKERLLQRFHIRDTVKHTADLFERVLSVSDRRREEQLVDLLR